MSDRLYPTTHNTHNRQRATSPEGFGPAIPGSERSQTHPLDRMAIEIGLVIQEIISLETNVLLWHAETLDTHSLIRLLIVYSLNGYW